MEQTDIWAVPPLLRKAVIVIAGIESLVFVLAIALVTIRPSAAAQIMAVFAILVFFFLTLPALLLAIINRWPILAAILAGIAALPMMGAVFGLLL